MNVVLTDEDGADTIQVLDTDFTIDGVGIETGGNVEMVTPPAINEQLTLYRVTEQTQETEYENNTAFPAETHETALDKLTMEIQELTETITRTVTIPISDDTENMVLPNEDTRANTYFYWDENGEPTTTTGTTVGGDHGTLGGLSDDDHTQYHNNTRGDARYYTKTQLLTTGVLDARYYTETELNAGQLDNRYYTETELNAGQLDTRYYTETEVDNNFVSNTDMTTISGDLINYVDNNTVTVSVITTTSGDIVSQIVTDHGALTGKDDDDHTQYLLADGSRQLSADWNFGSDTISGTGSVIVGDHGAAAVYSTVNVIYGTTAAPPVAASSVPEGTLYLRY
jgi:uncharacterized FlaG/YvyC family protein